MVRDTGACVPCTIPGCGRVVAVADSDMDGFQRQRNIVDESNKQRRYRLCSCVLAEQVTSNTYCNISSLTAEL